MTGSLAKLRPRFWCTALVLALQLAFLSPEALRVLRQDVGCRPDCPMHTRQLRCHRAPGADKPHCPQHALPRTVLHGEACACGVPHHDGSNLRQTALLPLATQLAGAVMLGTFFPPVSLRMKGIDPDPPFRPPRV